MNLPGLVRRICPSLAVLGCLGAGLLTAGISEAAPGSSKKPYAERFVLLQGNGSASQYEFDGGHFAMDTFRIDYAHTHDTAIRDIGIEAVAGYVRPTLGDDDAGSPFTLRATWRSMQEVESKTKHWLRNCRTKKCRIGSFRHDAEDKIALLAGFAIHNHRGARKVERVAIYPERTTGPNASTTYYAVFDAAGPTNYSVDLQVVFIDPAAVQGQHTAGAQSEAGKGFAEVPVKWDYYGYLALQGFDVRFKNGKHNVNRLGVRNVKGNNTVRAVHFADKNSDDPMEAKLWWADLKPLGPKVHQTDKPLNPQKKPIGGGVQPKIPLGKSKSKGKGTAKPGVLPKPKPKQKFPTPTPKSPLF